MPKITKTLIDSLPLPAQGEATTWDTELPNFGVRVQKGGGKSYIVQYRTRCSAKHRRKMTIAPCSHMPPDKARNLARDIFASVAAGNDPAADRRPKDRGPEVTLEQLFQARVEHMKAKGFAMAGHVERALLLSGNNAADFLGRKKHPGDITPSDIVDYVATFYKAGHRGAADKARSYLAATFSWAIKSANDYTVQERKDWGVKHNPVSDIAKDEGAATVRDRNLSAEELREFWTACSDGNAGFTEGTEACLQLIIACGQRVQETLRLDGIELDLEQKLWRMPAPKTKGKKYPHTIPLPDIIIPRLKALKEKHGDGPLFPAVHSSSATGILNHLAIANAVRRFCTRDATEMPAFQPRDLRRTWKSRAHDAGVDRFTRDLIQQHAKSDTGSKNYDRADYLPQMREAMDKWNAWLTAALKDPEPQQQLAA